MVPTKPKRDSGNRLSTLTVRDAPASKRTEGLYSLLTAEAEMKASSLVVPDCVPTIATQAEELPNDS